MTDSKLVAYVGRGLGSEPKTDLGGGRFIGWNRADKQVRLVAADVADQLLRDHPGQFALVDTLGDAAKRFSIKADKLAALKGVHHATFAKRGEEPQPVVILDADTQKAVDAEHKRAAKAKDKE
jgi:hypothetical protein